MEIKQMDSFYFSDIFTLSVPDEGYCREIRYLRLHYYHCVDTPADGLLVPESIIAVHTLKPGDTNLQNKIIYTVVNVLNIYIH
jgi:hypothetical protein